MPATTVALNTTIDFATEVCEMSIRVDGVDIRLARKGEGPWAVEKLETDSAPPEVIERPAHEPRRPGRPRKSRPIERRSLSLADAIGWEPEQSLTSQRITR